MQVLVLGNKMTCAMKLDYSDEEPHSLVLTQRQDTGQDVWSWVWMQWMTLHVPQHVAVSLFEPLNQMISHIQTGTQDLFWNNLLDELLATVVKVLFRDL